MIWWVWFWFVCKMNGDIDKLDDRGVDLTDFGTDDNDAVDEFDENKSEIETDIVFVICSKLADIHYYAVIQQKNHI